MCAEDTKKFCVSWFWIIVMIKENPLMQNLGGYKNGSTWHPNMRSLVLIFNAYVNTLSLIACTCNSMAGDRDK